MDQTLKTRFPILLHYRCIGYRSWFDLKKSVFRLTVLHTIAKVLNFDMQHAYLYFFFDIRNKIDTGDRRVCFDDQGIDDD